MSLILEKLEFLPNRRLEMVIMNKTTKPLLYKSEIGQSLTELALMFVFLVTLLAGIVDFGRAFFTYMALRDAAQEGAAYGSLNPNHEQGIKERVRQISNTPIDLASPEVTIEPVLEYEPCIGNKIMVTVRYDYPIMMPFLGAILGSQEIPLAASASDDIVRPPVCPTSTP